MPKYSIELVQVEVKYRKATVEVEAEDQQAARKAAASRGRSDPSLKWIDFHTDMEWIDIPKPAFQVRISDQG